jgi:ribosomal protein L40E
MRNVDIEIDGKTVKVPVCMKCYKRLRKEASKE